MRTDLVIDLGHALLNCFERLSGGRKVPPGNNVVIPVDQHNIRAEGPYIDPEEDLCRIPRVFSEAYLFIIGCR